MDFLNKIKENLYPIISDGLELIKMIEKQSANVLFYMIRCKDSSIKDTYIGHTTDKEKRFNNHKMRCNSLTNPKRNFRLYKFIRENGGWHNWEMIEIDWLECFSKKEAMQKEQYYIDHHKSTLNTSNAFGRNKDKLKEKNLRSYYKHHEKNKLAKRKYAEENKVLLAERGREYRERNSAQIKARRGRLCICDICAVQYTHDHKARHLRSKHHISAMKK